MIGVLASDNGHVLVIIEYNIEAEGEDSMLASVDAK